ncbi:hypothetical protein A3206_03415 [Candidatus Methanomassiliicoccus intestinalis]|uniref:Uncharacterized protein n=1 Tax=Methanomassiliicoccus intestinalis (strain Issoire-Mx1) TaxID=1295009 RepID=R9T8C9_METII|nr:InlB B-repeat-containing protein [Candidatus Methanomassiliicoccus intestinalis]AGN26914.1 hypothetical protein MMINT_16110 [Candidatus Methanomassiliicoccus intestinalis Issoire-Mx1]TQS83887.1 MAG: hypothetical protein A3206_03415 [Candidatus Methanomassiliicoccus intestinalis]
MSKNNKIITAAIAVVALLIIIVAVFASGILAHDSDDVKSAEYEVNFIDGDDILKSISVKENNLVNRISDPVKEGYVFTGWYSDKELTNEFDFNDTYITENTNIYAKWVKSSEPEPGDITFTVTFNTDGGNEIASQIVKKGENAVRPADPIKSGYKFAGWYSDSSFTTEFNFKSPINFDITLYAKFTLNQGGGGGGAITPPPVTPEKYTVTFNSNGGSAVPSESVESGKTVSEPTTAPTKEGYAFAGWYDGSDFTTKFDFNNTKINSDKTLYAKWTPGTYTAEGDKVTVNISEEQINEIINSPNDTITLVDASAFNTNSVSIDSSVLQNVKENLSSSDPNNNKKIEIALPNASIELGKTAIENILYKSGGEELSFSASKIDNLDTSVINNSDVVLDSDSIYEFKIGDGSISTFGEVITVSIPYDLDGANEEDIVVYYLKGGELLQIAGKYDPKNKCVNIQTDHFSTFAVGNIGRFTVNFDLDGGVFSTEDFDPSDYVYLKFNANIKEITPTKTGYSFNGWDYNGSIWNFANDVVKKNISLKATWTQNSYNIDYELNGGSSSDYDKKYTIKSETINLGKPVKAGHTFQGWFTDSNLKTPFNYVSGVTCDNLTLYAKWSINEYSVTLLSGEGYKLNYLNNQNADQNIKVKYGDNFSFTLELYGTYENSNIAVKDIDGNEIRPINEVYTLNNITKDQVVAVEGIEADPVDSYNMIFANESEAYSVNQKGPVEKGNDFTFTISLTDAYSKSAALSLQIYGSYDSFALDTSSGNNHTYTIKNVISDLVIIVNGLEKNTYTVTFMSENKKILDQTVTHGESASLIKNLTRPGYEFGGWAFENGTKYTNQQITEDTTLYAVWSAGSSNYFIYVYQEKVQSSGVNTYELIKVEQKSETIGTEINVTSDEYHTNEILGDSKGFKLNESMSKLNGTVSSESPLVLSLYFDRIEFTITFLAQDGSQLTTDGRTVAKITAKYGQPVYPVRVVLPDNAILDYWHKSGEEALYTFTTMPAENLTLCAKYASVYTLSYNANGGEGSLPFSVLYSPGTKVTLFGPGYPEDNTYALTKEGYTFSGWMYDGTVYQPKDTFVMLEEDVTLVAKWTANKYTITFNSNGGSDVTSITEDYGKVITKPADPTKTGYTFAGWFKDEGLTTAWNFETDTMPVNGTTLYAKWQPNKYTLTINYVYEDSSKAAESYSESLDYDSSYDVTPPEISGYLPDRSTVSGIINGNISITVTYGAYVASIGKNNYRTLEDALDVATAGDKVILLRDYTLTRSVTVPKGVFLVLPCADDDKGYDLTVDYEQQHNPDGTVKDKGSYSTLYRSLTVSETATITLDGQLLVNAVTGRAEGGYRVMDITGGYAQILLEGNIIIKNEGILEVCGYITGSGQITAEYGAEVREMYIVQHWRGGSQALAIYPDLFPFNEYDCHSIQSDLRIESGASLFGNVKMYETWYKSYHYTRFPQIDNENGLIRLADGAYAVISFDSSAVNGESSSDTGRTTIEIYGGATFSHSTLLIVGLELSTKEFIYPIDGDISFGLHDGDYFIENSFKALTGVEVTLYEHTSLTLNAKGAEVNSSNSKLEKNTLVFYDNFNDVNNTDTTEYPQRPAAILNLMDDSTFNIYGVFAGIINFEGKLGNAVVNTKDAISLKLDTIEVNGYVGDYSPTEITAHGFVNLPFETKYQYTILFDSNGGSDQPPMKYIAGDEIEELPVPERLGYDFKGWYSDSALTQLCNPDSITSGNLTLYAGWADSKYTVSFNSNGGSSVSNQTINYNETAKKPSDPIRSGFTFDAWYADKELNQKYDFNTPVTENTTIYANWNAIVYTISFVTNCDETLDSMDYTTDNASLNIGKISKTGYDFKAWYLDKELTSEFKFKQYETVGDLTLYADWTPTVYTIKYYDGTELNLEPHTYTIEDTVTLPTPVKKGYEFAGWHEKQDLTDDAIFTIAEGTIGNKAYYASWKESVYSITYMDGKNKIENLSPVSYTTTVRTELPTPSKEGYAFTGWYSDADFKNKVSSIPNGSTGDKIFYAKFTINQYTITFESNGGSETGAVKQDYGTTITKPADPTKTGYTFAGWFKDNNTFLQEWNFDTDTMPVNGTTIYANWDLDTYTITLHDGDSISTVNYDVTMDSVSLNKPSKEGYTFNGWFEKDSQTEFKYVKGTTVGNKDLYAEWTINQYAITFESNGGSAVKSIEQNYGTIIEKPSDPTKTGYTFAGWFKDDETFLQEWNFDTDTIPVNGKTIYAKWTPMVYSIIFDANGGTGSMKDQPFIYDEAKNLAANTFSRTGYNFLGWSLNQSATNVEYADQASVNNLASENEAKVTLYAVWQINKYTITFNSNGGSNVTSITQDYDTTVDKPEDPTKTGYTFAGWFTDAEFANAYKFGKMPAENITLYAKWTINQYTITFNSNGGSAVDAVKQDYGTTIAKPEDPTKDGHSFAGWFKDETLTTAWNFKTDTIPVNGTTLYAKWDVISYNVRYYVDSNIVLDKNVKYGESVPKPTDPTKTGHTFIDWGIEIPQTMPAKDLEFHATFEINSYKITYMIDGETVETQTYEYGAEISPYQPAAQEGKEFSGWSPGIPATMPANDMTVSGSFDPSKFTITYYVDGIQYESPQSVTFGEAVTPMIAPTEVGYSFSGWDWNEDEEGLGEAPQTMPAKHLSVYGYFTINSYDVTFHYNNGTNNTTTSVNFNSSITKPEVSRLGYTLEGWYLEDSFTTKWEFNADKMPANDIDLYAKWNLDTYKIKLHNGSDVQSIGYNITQDVSLPSESKKGYTFNGWFEQNSHAAFEYIKGTTVGDKDLYAEFTINQYTISFNSNGGSTVKNITDDYDKAITKPGNPTKTGYTFDGWFTDNGTFNNEYSFTAIPAENVTLYAKWILDSYSIKYYDESSEISDLNPKSYTIESGEITLENATKTGYIFAGWYDTADLSGTAVSSISANSTGDKTFYAKFVANSYSVIFNANGGTGSMDPQTFTYGTSQNLTANTFTRTGHDFKGWSTDSNAIDATYNDQDSVSNLTPDANGSVNLYAVWQINQYTITFESNGGSAVADITKNYGSEITKPENPTKTGYTFAGWFTDSEFANAYAFDKMPAKDITLYSKWTINLYNVTFHYNNGTVDTTDPVEFNNLVAEPKNVSRLGYTLEGWYLEDSFTTKWEFNADKMPAENIDLYAKWTSITYNISFNLGEGSGSIPDMEYTVEISITLPTPTREGYVFVGWYENGAKFEYTKGQTVDDHSLVAKWTAENYTIIYMDGDSKLTAEPGWPTKYTSERATDLPASATKTGYTFEGWYANADCLGNKETSISAQSIGNKVFYAKFVPYNYTVIFNANSGTGSMNGQPFAYDETKNLTANAFIKEGYIFIGWSKTPDGSVDYRDQASVSNLTSENKAEVTLYAVWQINQYAITFNSNGGSEVASITTEYGSTITKPVDPSRTGYVFGGWYSDEGLSNSYIFGSAVTENLNLYANWTPIKYRVTFYPNGGEGRAVSASFNYDELKPLTLNTFTKEGCKFIGWSLDQNAIEPTYYDGEIVNLTSVNRAQVNLYAIWSSGPYVVSLPNNPIDGHTYTVKVAEGYDESSAEYLKPFEFIITFDDELLDNLVPIVNYDGNYIIGTTSDGLTYSFIIDCINGNITSSRLDVINLDEKLNALIDGILSDDFSVVKTGKTILVSIKNANSNAAELMSALSMLGNLGHNSVRTNDSTLLSYLPSDEDLWEDNNAQYTINTHGYSIIFKQDTSELEKIKIEYLTKIEQAVRVFRDNTTWYPVMKVVDSVTKENIPWDEVISTSAGIEYLDGVEYKYIDLPILYTAINGSDISIFNALTTNFATVMVLIGHEDLRYGTYSTDTNFGSDMVEFGSSLFDPNGNINGNYISYIYKQALSFLKYMGLPITTINDPLAKCFDENGIGYGGFARQYCISGENGLRYTDIYHFKFSNCTDAGSKPKMHTLTNSQGISLQDFGLGNSLIDDSLVLYKNEYGASMLGKPNSLTNVYESENTRFVKGELIVFEGGYSQSNLTITSTAGDIIWYNDHSFIMPDGDVTITINQ